MMLLTELPPGWRCNASGTFAGTSSQASGRLPTWYEESELQLKKQRQMFDCCWQMLIVIRIYIKPDYKSRHKQAQHQHPTKG